MRFTFLISVYPYIFSNRSAAYSDAVYSDDLDTVTWLYQHIRSSPFPIANFDLTFALTSGGAAEPPPPDPIYRHPSSPNYGAHWTRDTVVFDNIRLSNKISSSSASDKKIGLNSLHQYEPRDVFLSRNCLGLIKTRQLPFETLLKFCLQRELP